MYTDYIQFHILIMICVLLLIENRCYSENGISL